jgi:hypothetical protein
MAAIERAEIDPRALSAKIVVDANNAVVERPGIHSRATKTKPLRG